MHPRFSPLKKNISRSLAILLLVAACIMPTLAQKETFRLAPLFTDDMVLQQQRDVPVWGKAGPGAHIMVQTTWGAQVNTKADAKGDWSLKLPTPKAGGPYSLYFFHDDAMTVLNNVLVGEVWVCSGQSNMEMPLQGWPPRDTIKSSAREIAAANYPTLRFFSVRRTFAASPSDICEGRWLICSPSTAPEFSATAFFFGKFLQQDIKVPVGLINTSFGGTPVEAWMNDAALKKFSEYTGTLKKIEASRSLMQGQTGWINNHPTISVRERPPQHRWEGLKFGDGDCMAPAFDDRSWHEMKLPTLWERDSIGEFDGAVWFRKHVVINRSWIGKDLILHLGPIDDADETYVNGIPVGSHLTEGYYNIDRIYKVPGSLVSDSSLVIAVRVLDWGGGGGIWGDAKGMWVAPDTASPALTLAGDWKYLPVAEYRSGVFYIYGAKGDEFSNRPKLPIDFSQNTATALFNAMINPLVPFSIRGAIWYQGESNTGQPILYRELFPAMIRNWRSVFKSGDFPFYYVQIAPFDYGTETPSELLREAQMMTMKVKNTGMAVTLDVGNPKNIHPTDKEDVGKRLALWALAKTYGKHLTYSGPVYKSMKVENEKIVLSFDHTERGLQLKPRPEGLGFQIAGSDKVFKDAVAEVRSSTVVVSSPDVHRPVAVRYAFTNVSQSTLFNGAGLPASSFRTDNWK